MTQKLHGGRSPRDLNVGRDLACKETGRGFVVEIRGQQVSGALPSSRRKRPCCSRWSPSGRNEPPGLSPRRHFRLYAGVEPRLPPQRQGPVAGDPVSLRIEFFHRLFVSSACDSLPACATTAALLLRMLKSDGAAGEGVRPRLRGWIPTRRCRSRRPLRGCSLDFVAIALHQQPATMSFFAEPEVCGGPFRECIDRLLLGCVDELHVFTMRIRLFG